MGEASSRNQALRAKAWSEHAKEPYVKADGNFIFFNTWTHEKGQPSIDDYKVYDQVLTKACEVRQKNSSGK